MLSYDCGVLLKQRGARTGIGTLVLVRPAAIGEERTSDVLALPVPGTGTVVLELAIYLRRLNEQASRVVCEIMRSHSFVPTLTADRQARLQVGMRVDQDEALGATVTVDVHDLNAGEHIRFHHLPLKGIAPLTELPVRDARQLKAVEWADQIEAIRRAVSGDAVKTVRDWRAWFENRGGVSRRDFARHLLGAAVEFVTVTGAVRDLDADEVAKGAQVLANSRLNDPDFVANATPGQFHAEGRKTLFGAMRYGASLLTKLSCNHCAAWRREFGASDPAPADDQCANMLFNAVSQDLAGRDIESVVLGAASRLTQMYHWVCQLPQTLNIAWDGSLD